VPSYVLLAVLLVGLGMTLAETPHPRHKDIPEQVVFVVGEAALLRNFRFAHHQ
jgi:hypothetical protein